MKDFPFVFDLKAANNEDPLSIAAELDDGDLLISGWGCNYDVIDRELEIFKDNSLSKGIKKFLSGAAPLIHHHHYDQVIGKVIDAQEIPGKGVKIRAIVDKQEPTSPLYHVYNGIKRGRIAGLSVGGLFKRELGPDGIPRITDVDILEWSATATPVGPQALFSVIAGKALTADPDLSPEEEVEIAPARPGTPTLVEPAEAEQEGELTASEEAQAAARPESEENKLARETAEAEEAERVRAEEEAARIAAAEADAAEIQALVGALDGFGERLEAIAARWAKPTEEEVDPEAAVETSTEEPLNPPAEEA